MIRLYDSNRRRAFLGARLTLALAFTVIWPGQSFAMQNSARGQAMASDLRVRLVDYRTRKPIVNANVTVVSDNGIRCIKAPCPTNTLVWNGTTDDLGIIVVPGNVIQRSVSFTAGLHSGSIDLLKMSQPPSSKALTIRLGIVKVFGAGTAR